MTILFLETAQATYGLQFYGSGSGSVTRDTTAARDPLGLSSWKCDSGASNLSAYIERSTVLPTGANVGARVSGYFYLTNLPSSTQTILIVGIIRFKITSTGILQLWNEDIAQIGSNGSTISINTLYRFCIVCLSNASSQVTNVKLFKDGVQDISVTGLTLSQQVYLALGWRDAPGANKVLNLSHVYVDDVTDLTDPAPAASYSGLYVTAKLPAAVNNNQYTTTGGTGAVNERPLVEANHKAELGKVQFLQDYTLQTAAVGDKDISGAGITLVARSAWMWARLNKADTVYIMDNGNSATGFALNSTYTMCTKLTDSATYPSNAAGIGQKSTGTAQDSFLAECGTLIAYLVAVVGVKRSFAAVIA